MLCMVIWSNKVKKNKYILHKINKRNKKKINLYSECLRYLNQIEASNYKNI